MENFKNEKIAVVLVHWKFLNDTIECMESLQRSTDKNFDIIISNNDEADFPVQQLQNQKNIMVINNYKNLGFIKACNIGFQLALKERYRFIFMLNNDTVVAPETLMVLKNYAHHHPNEIISPISYLYGTDVSVENAGGTILWPIGVSKLNKVLPKKSPDYLSGACIFAQHQHFQKIGLLDETYEFYWDDSDWSMRARSQGFSLKILSDAKIWHKHSASDGKKRVGWSEKKSFYIARNTFYFAKKNLKNIKKILFIMGYIFLGSILHAFLFCRSFPSIKGLFKGILMGIKYLNTPKRNQTLKEMIR